MKLKKIYLVLIFVAILAAIAFASVYMLQNNGVSKTNGNQNEQVGNAENLEHQEAAAKNDDVLVSIGEQEMTERDISIMRNLIAEGEHYELIMGMHVFSEIRNMLLFRYAKEIGVAPTDAETRIFIEEQARTVVSEQELEMMDITSEEYWDGIGFRLAQNLLAADRIMDYLNANDSATTYSIEQYQNYTALGNELMQEWMRENPDLVVQFNLDKAAEIFSGMS